METRNFSQQEWHKIVSQFQDLSLIQLWEYGEAKAETQGWQVVRHVFTCDGVVVGAAQAMVKYIPFMKKGLVWINRAPFFQRFDAEPNFVLLQGILEELRQYWVKQKKMYLRVAPPITLIPAPLPEGEGRMMWRGGGEGWMSAVVDLAKSEQELRQKLDKKWRNCLVKAEKLGLTYDMGTSPVHTDELINDYKALFGRKEFTSVTPEFLSALQALLPDDRKMIVLSGRLGTQRLGSILIARYGDTAEYLVGAVSPRGRALNAGQFLLWRALIEMKRLELKRFDLGGMHPQKTPKGIFHFKQGLGGKPYQLVGEFEAVKGMVALMIKLIVKYRT